LIFDKGRSKYNLFLLKDIPHKANTNGNEKSLKELFFRYAVGEKTKRLPFFVVSNFLSSYSYKLKTSRRTLWKNETIKSTGLLNHK